MQIGKRNTFPKLIRSWCHLEKCFQFEQLSLFPCDEQKNITNPPKDQRSLNRSRNGPPNAHAGQPNICPIAHTSQLTPDSLFRLRMQLVMVISPNWANISAHTHTLIMHRLLRHRHRKGVPWGCSGTLKFKTVALQTLPTWPARSFPGYGWSLNTF